MKNLFKNRPAIYKIEDTRLNASCFSLKKKGSYPLVVIKINMKKPKKKTCYFLRLKSVKEFFLPEYCLNHEAWGVSK